MGDPLCDDPLGDDPRILFGYVYVDKQFEQGYISLCVINAAGMPPKPNLNRDEGLRGPTNLSWIRETGNTLQKRFSDPGETHVLLPL